MSVQFRRVETHKNLIPVLPGASTVRGFIYSTDIDRLVVKSSNNGVLAVGTTADDQTFLGVIAAVPAASTPASTVAFYVMPISPRDELTFNFSTGYSTALPATTDIGKYIGWGNTTTVAGADLSMGTVGNAAGTTSGCFLRITGFDVDRRQIFGTINSTHLAL